MTSFEPTSSREQPDSGVSASSRSSALAVDVNCESCLSRHKRVRLTPPLIRWRNIMMGTGVTYVFLCISLMTVLYAARRSVTVVILNSIHGICGSVATMAFVKVHFWVMLGSLSALAAVTGVILLYALVVTIAVGDASYLLLHGSMIVAMDGPYLGLLAKATYTYYKDWHNNAEFGPPVRTSLIVIGQAQQAQPQMAVVGRISGRPALSSQPALCLSSEEEFSTLTREEDNQVYSTPEAITQADEFNVCPICLGRIKNVAMIPCGHLICSSCAPLLMPTFPIIAGILKCPMCRKNVTQFVKVYV